jgi:hypothetical protein
MNFVFSASDSWQGLMSASVSKQRLLDVLKVVRDGKPGFFKQWASHHAKFGVWNANADTAQVLVNVYGGMPTLQALAAAGLDRVYIDDLTAVVGAKRAAHIVSLIDLKAGRVTKQPIRKLGLMAGRIAFALAVVAAIWIKVSDAPPEDRWSAADESSIATADESGSDPTSSETPLRLPSCAMYSAFKIQLGCTDHITNSLAPQDIPTTSEARQAERKMFSAINSYPASAECRDFTDQIEGLVGGQVASIAASFAGGSVTHADIVNACSAAYGEALLNYCGAVPGGCDSVIPK